MYLARARKMFPYDIYRLRSYWNAICKYLSGCLFVDKHFNLLYMLSASFWDFLSLFSDPEVWGDMRLWNVRWLSPDYVSLILEEHPSIPTAVRASHFTRPQDMVINWRGLIQRIPEDRHMSWSCVEQETPTLAVNIAGQVWQQMSGIKVHAAKSTDLLPLGSKQLFAASFCTVHLHTCPLRFATSQTELAATTDAVVWDLLLGPQI